MVKNAVSQNSTVKKYHVISSKNNILVFLGQIYAHFHKDSFRFLQVDEKNGLFNNSSYILLMPSVSVVYRNNPNFRIVHLDPDLQAITDYEQLYMNLVIVTGEIIGSTCQRFVKTLERLMLTGFT